MRCLTVLLAMVVAMSATAPAQAQQRRDKDRKDWTERQEPRPQRRSSTVGPNGACQRDTGRPADTLNLNHQCDREEFWARFNDTGGNSRR